MLLLLCLVIYFFIRAKVLFTNQTRSWLTMLSWSSFSTDLVLSVNNVQTHIWRQLLYLVHRDSVFYYRLLVTGHGRSSRKCRHGRSSWSSALGPKIHQIFWRRQGLCYDRWRECRSRQCWFSPSGSSSQRFVNTIQSILHAHVHFNKTKSTFRLAGLFHRAIAESGSMLTDWALDRDARKHGLRIAELANCPLEPYADLLHCLRSMDAIELRRAQGAFSVSFLSSVKSGK